MGLPADIARTGAHPRNKTDTAGLSLRNKILLAIPETEVRLVHPLLQPFEFRQHTILHEPTQKLEFAYFPNRGLISLLVATVDGKTVEVGMVGNEGVAGVASAVGLNFFLCRIFAARLTPGRSVPSMVARKSWVMGSELKSTRSAAISNQRARRSPASCSR